MHIWRCCWPDGGGCCLLGHRAKMRLLEDATVDACDQAGEDELISDCTLTDTSAVSITTTTTTKDEEEKMTKRRKNR